MNQNETSAEATGADMDSNNTWSHLSPAVIQQTMFLQGNTGMENFQIQPRVIHIGGILLMTSQ